MAYDGDTVAKRIGELLVEAGVLSQSQLEQALFAQRKDGRKLGQLLIELGLVPRSSSPRRSRGSSACPGCRSITSIFALPPQPRPPAVAEKYCMVPIFVRRVRKLGETLYVAMDDPTNEAAIEDVTRASTLPVKPMIACPSDIRAAIRVYYQGEEGAGAAPVVPAASAGAPPAIAVVRPARASAGRPPRSKVPPRRRTARASAPSPRAGSAAPALLRAGHRARARAPLERVAGGAMEAPQLTHDRRKGGRRSRSRAAPRMIALTLLDGTTINIPGPPKRRSRSRPQIESTAPRSRRAPGR